MSGTLITLEGLDCSGKSTNVEYIASYLSRKGYTVTTTKEPFNDNVKQIIHQYTISNNTQLALFLADRLDHIEQVIKPALDRGEVVVCDRFIDSTIAYQGYGNGHNVHRLKALMSYLSNDIYPHLTLFFDITPEESVARLRSRKHIDTQFENYEFLSRVYAGYQHEMDTLRRRVEFINAMRPLPIVQSDLTKILDSKF